MYLTGSNIMRTKDSEYEQLDKPRWLLSVLDGFSEFIMKENSKKKQVVFLVLFP
jgi:hypothetical protein